MGKCCSLGNENAIFLRTAEFLWQEGHTAHATKEEAIAEAEQMNKFMQISLKNIWQCLLFKD